jgi:hypothetical protein
LYTQAVRATNAGTGEVFAASVDGLTGRGAVGVKGSGKWFLTGP